MQFDNIIAGNFSPAAPSEPVRAEPPAKEVHEVAVTRRQAQSVVAQWLRIAFPRVLVSQNGKRCEMCYPNPGKGGGMLSVFGDSWWHVLRQVHADLLRDGHLPHKEE